MRRNDRLHHAADSRATASNVCCGFLGTGHTIKHFLAPGYCAADLLPSGDPAMGAPCGMGRAATLKPRP